MQKISGLLLALTLSMLSWQSAKATPTMKVYGSPDCGNYQWQVIYGSLAITFDEFAVESGENLYQSKNCYLRVSNIHVPAGKQFRPIQAFVDGEVFTADRGSATVNLSYRWNGDAVSGEQEFGPGIHNGDTFVIQTGPADWWSYSQCQDTDQYVTIEGQIHISARADPDDQLTSTLLLANSEAKSQAFWEWQWRDCTKGKWWGNSFRARYTNVDGRWIRHYLQLKGENGSFHLDNGAKGVFEQVRYQDEGQVAEGIWRFQNGQSGWFQFTLSLDEESFTGHWGYGTKIGHKPAGQWKGYRSR